jgi:hypothetical protein
MKTKKLLPALLLFSIPLLSVGQSTFYDVQLLKRYSTINAETDIITVSPRSTLDPVKMNLEYDSILSVLKKYFPGITPTMNTDSFELIVSPNPFFKTIIYPGRTLEEGAAPTLRAKLGQITSSVGGINVTNFADGLARFMVERFKQELSVAFFKKFKEQLDDPKYGDLKILFPNTHKTLVTIDQDIYQYSAYLNTLRQAFIKDMTSQYTNIKNLLNQPKYQEYFRKNHPELGTVLRTSFYIIDGYSTGRHPGEILAEFNPQASIDIGDTLIECNVIGSIKTIQLLSGSFRSLSESNFWVPADSVRMLLKDDTGLRIYLGLVYQKTDGIDFMRTINDTLSLRKVLDLVADNVKAMHQYKSFIQTLSEQAQEVSDMLSALRGKKKSEIDFNEYYKLFEASLDLFDMAKDFIELPYVDLGEEVEAKVNRNCVRMLYVARSSGELFVDVRTKNYSSGIMNLLGIMDTLLSYNTAYAHLDLKKEYKNLQNELAASLKQGDDMLADKRRKRRAIYKSIGSYVDKFSRPIDINVAKEAIGKNWDSLTSNEREFVFKMSGILLAMKDPDSKSELRKFIFKYGTFIAAVAEAQSSEDVKNAIEAIAMPAGSYSVKRNASTNIAINGYMGFGSDHGTFGNKTAKAARDKYSLNYSIYAPVGVSFSKGNFWCGSSATIFMSVIDIGSIANFRLKDDTSLLKRTITVSDIFSPGVTLIYGFPRLPLSLSAGLIYKPKLIFENKQNEFIGVPGMVRFNISLLVDIPIVNLYTRSR